MDSNKSKRVVVYCRVATQAQLDGDHTLEAQSARLHEQAERLGYEIVGEISEYEKGTTLDRDGWKRACQEAVEQKADILLVTDLSILFFVRFSISEMFANRKKLSRYRMYEENISKNEYVSPCQIAKR